MHIKQNFLLLGVAASPSYGRIVANRVELAKHVEVEGALIRFQHLLHLCAHRFEHGVFDGVGLGLRPSRAGKNEQKQGDLRPTWAQVS